MPSASVTEVYDMQTVPESITAIKFHSPQDALMVRHLAGLFLQYRRFRYVGCDIQLVPAAVLPLDPLGVSLDPGEPNADPRDVLNPILHRYYHGEWNQLTPLIFEKLFGDSGVGASPQPRFPTGQSIDVAEIDRSGSADLHLYGNTLMDSSFRKSGIQQGFRVRCKPFVYRMQTSRQLGASRRVAASSIDTADFSNPGGGDPAFAHLQPGDDRVQHTLPNVLGTSAPTTEYVQALGISGTPVRDPGATMSYGPVPDQGIFTSGLERLGWMDTIQPAAITGVGPGGSPNVTLLALNVFRMPKVLMYIALLPPAFKQVFYFRCVIKHYFDFASFRSLVGLSGGPAADLTLNFTPASVAGTSSTSNFKSISLDLDDSVEDIPSVVMSSGTSKLLGDGASE